eukprot:3908605-Ditylum_brightwellii.AAC.1
MLEKVLDLFNTLDMDKCCKCSTGKIDKALVKDFVAYAFATISRRNFWVLFIPPGTFLHPRVLWLVYGFLYSISTHSKLFACQTLRGDPALLDTIAGVPSAKKA